MNPGIKTAASSLGLALISFLFGNAVAAQVVEVRPGYVRAPFVEIHSHPDGSSHIRAPFVNLHTLPGFRLVPPPIQIVPHRVEVTTAVRVAAPPNLEHLDWRSLREVALRAVAELDRSLSRVTAAAEWRRYLQIEELSGLLAVDNSSLLSDPERISLAQILETYDATLRSPNMRHITSLAGFRTVRQALIQLVKSPVEEESPVGEEPPALEAAVFQLRRELEQRGADGWIGFLKLHLLTGQSNDNPLPPAPGAPNQTEGDVGDVLERFELVEREPRYRRIAELPGFRSVMNRLREYPGASSEPGAAAAEQLPPPDVAVPDVIVPDLDA